ncbi:hypothetical protein [Streptomyces sp. DG1A-41]|uniref:hypothetical protein n=1 Tax=Streptomyces sp. DG1A-41 TaxID=3125779 RepID=UPI0030CF6A03
MSSVSTQSRPSPSQAAAQASPPPVLPVDVVQCTVFSAAGQGLGALADALRRGMPAEQDPGDEVAAAGFPRSRVSCPSPGSTQQTFWAARD